MAAPLGSHYEVLGIDSRATPEQVDKAYRFCLEMYGERALATYSLLEPAEMRAARRRVQDAYEVLRDPTRRLEYDVSLGLTGAGASLLLPFPSLAAAKPSPAPADPGVRSSPTVLAGPVTGEKLRRFREERGISLHAISAASKVGVTMLEWIESDHYERLPAQVYLRGFLQEYARAVGLDPRATAQAYLARLAKPT